MASSLAAVVSTSGVYTWPRLHDPAWLSAASQWRPMCVSLAPQVDTCCAAQHFTFMDDGGRGSMRRQGPGVLAARGGPGTSRRYADCAAGCSHPPRHSLHGLAYTSQVGSDTSPLLALPCSTILYHSVSMCFSCTASAVPYAPSPCAQSASPCCSVAAFFVLIGPGATCTPAVHMPTHAYTHAFISVRNCSVNMHCMRHLQACKAVVGPMTRPVCLFSL